jgi:hypothetical protein
LAAGLRTRPRTVWKWHTLDRIDRLKSANRSNRRLYVARRRSARRKRRVAERLAVMPRAFIKWSARSAWAQLARTGPCGAGPSIIQRRISAARWAGIRGWQLGRGGKPSQRELDAAELRARLTADLERQLSEYRDQARKAWIDAMSGKSRLRAACGVGSGSSHRPACEPLLPTGKLGLPAFALFSPKLNRT